MAGMCRSIKGQYPEAIQEFQTARTMNPEATFPLAGPGNQLCQIGQQDRRNQSFAGHGETGEGELRLPNLHRFGVRRAGERDKEFACYAKGYDDRAEWLLWLNLDPLFDEVRGDPRFQGLIRRVGVTG